MQTLLKQDSDPSQTSLDNKAMQTTDAKLIEMKHAKNFIQLYTLLVVLFFIVPLGFSYVLLQRSGENLSFPEIVRRQLANNAIYGSVITDNAYIYKLELLRQVKPDVIALGSSRVLQFREEFFKARFVNCGLAMRSLHEGKVFISEILRVHKPKVILLGVDFWWFLDNGHTPTEDDMALSQASIMPDRFSVPKLIQPLKYIAQRKLAWPDMAHILFTPAQPNGVTRFESIGISAMKTSDGFRKDGSNFYAAQIFGLTHKKFHDEHFKSALRRVHTGTARFQYGKTVSAEKLKEFNEILALCKRNHIQVVLFIPPLAEPVYQAMMAMTHHEYDYIQTYRNIVATAPIEHYDFMEANSVKSGSCEFFDGYHGGDVTYARILRTILQANPNSALAPLVAIDTINQVIQRYPGVAMIPFHPEFLPLKEVDFLRLGCAKSPR